MNRHILTLLLFFFLKETIAQPVVSDSISNYPGVKSAIALYHNSTGEQSPLYNGVRHEGYRFDIKGLAYFETKEWRDGSVLYEGILYKNISVLYDEVEDKLIIHNIEKDAAISLVSERTGSFYLSGHTFLYVETDTGLKTSGFYDVLYNGKVSLLVKREKYIKEDVNQVTIEREFVSNYQYYLRKENRHYFIKNIKSVFSIFGDKEKEIKLFIKKNDLSFKENPELTLKMVTEYYDQLTSF